MPARLALLGDKKMPYFIDWYKTEKQIEKLETELRRNKVSTVIRHTCKRKKNKGRTR